MDMSATFSAKTTPYPEIGDGNFNMTHSHFID